jgi:glutamate racemase
MDNRKIGVFDSGVGGLTVVSEIYKQLPNEEIIYFGDTERSPYGSKPKETIHMYTKQIVKFLKSFDVKMIVIACNTATIISIEELREELDIPIIGVVQGAISMALLTTKNNKIGIIGTEHTIKSEIHETLLKKENDKIDVFSKACPLLVNIAEEGLSDTDIGFYACKHYVDSLVQNGVDTIVLACTHYKLHENNFKKILDCSIKIVDPAIKTAENLSEILTEKNMLRCTHSKPIHEFYVSGVESKFSEIYGLIFNENCKAKKVDLS